MNISEPSGIMNVMNLWKLRPFACFLRSSNLAAPCAIKFTQFVSCIGTHEEILMQEAALKGHLQLMADHQWLLLEGLWAVASGLINSQLHLNS